MLFIFFCDTIAIMGVVRPTDGDRARKRSLSFKWEQELADQDDDGGSVQPPTDPCYYYCRQRKLIDQPGKQCVTLECWCFRTNHFDQGRKRKKAAACRRVERL
jgi:hypothetical protein